MSTKQQKNLRVALIILCILSLGFAGFRYISSQQLDKISAETNPSYKIGETVKDFSLKNIDGNMIGLNTNTEAKGYILVVTSNHCPYAKVYESRIAELYDKYTAQGYELLAINANNPNENGEDTFEENAKMAETKKMKFKYLTDETQEVAKAFGASKTPTAFIISKQADGFVLKYAGAIDDNAQSPKNVKTKYVENAMAEVLANKAVTVSSTKAIGCGIKWKRD